MGAIGKRVENDIREAMARQMPVGSVARCKYKPRADNAAFFGLAPQVLYGLRIVAKQPKHASFDTFQQPHPEIEHLRSDFEAVVE
jgi:hypothetical protein